MPDRARTSTRWLSTMEAARQIGVSDWWVRDRIDQRLLPANVVSTGARRIYRIATEDWERFKARYVGLAADPQFEPPRPYSRRVSRDSRDSLG